MANMGGEGIGLALIIPGNLNIFAPLDRYTDTFIFRAKTGFL